MSYKTALTKEMMRYGDPDNLPEPRRSEVICLYRTNEADNEMYAKINAGWKPEIGWEASNGCVIRLAMYNLYNGGLTIEWDHPRFSTGD